MGSIIETKTKLQIQKSRKTKERYREENKTIKNIQSKIKIKTPKLIIKSIHQYQYYNKIKA